MIGYVRTAPGFVLRQSMGKSFGSLEVLKGATLWCDAGSVSALLGRKGSGKTTLLECAFGLRRADYGVVHLEEHAYERPAPIGWPASVSSIFPTGVCFPPDTPWSGI